MGHPTKKVSSAIIKRTIDTLGINVNEFAAKTGQSPSAVHGWIRDGMAPAWVSPACEGLKARAEAQDSSADDVVMLVKIAAREKETATKLLNALGATVSTI